MDTFLFAVLFDCFCVVEFSIDMVFNYSLNHSMCALEPVA